MTGLSQIDLFGDAPARAPVVAGFDYWADVLSAPEQAALVAALQTLAFKPYEHLGYLGHRRIAAFYREGDGPRWPTFLSTLMARLAGRLDLDGAAFVQVLVNEYGRAPASAGIATALSMARSWACPSSRPA